MKANTNPLSENALVDGFLADTRLYALVRYAPDVGSSNEAHTEPSGDPLGQLLVELWRGDEGLSTIDELEIQCISTHAELELNDFIGVAVSLQTKLDTGEKLPRNGIIRQIERLASDGGFTRYSLRVVPWYWYLSRGRHNQVFQERTVLEIVEEIFGAYAGIAAWQIADDVPAFLAHSRPRSFCVQFNESDLEFISRLLADEGLGFCCVTDDNAPSGHALRIFARSDQFPENRSSAEAAGLPVRRASNQTTQEAIQRLGATRRFTQSALRSATYDYKTAQIITAIQTDQGPSAGLIPESFDYAGSYAYATTEEADHHARLALEASQAQQKTWSGESGVRSLRCGEYFCLARSTEDAFYGDTEMRDESEDGGFCVLSVEHAGVNNLPASVRQSIEQHAGGLPLSEHLRTDSALLTRARQWGYANRFTAMRRDVPWRPSRESGALRPERPRISGAQTAIVVGPDGHPAPQGRDCIYTDALGRVRVRFHWQAGDRGDDRHSCWLRCAQTSAGARLGSQFIPRIGQEVLVAFMGGDCDRPIIVGSVYNGTGEGGIAPTPGGRNGNSDRCVFEQANDFSASGQGNLAGGNSPTWHGAAAGLSEHLNPGALSGFKSREFGGPGHNQLVFDDSDAQQRVQMASSQASTQLNLGHLRHQQDNYLGSFRGAGFELRSDAYGALRGARGLLLSTWPSAEPAPSGEFDSPGKLLQQATRLAEAYSPLAATHAALPLASINGAEAPAQSIIDGSAGPLAALLQTATARLSPDGSTLPESEKTRQHETNLPHSADPIVAIASRAGIGTVAGQAAHLHAGETLSLGSGADASFACGQRYRIHSGQATGLLAGAEGKGDGLKLIASQGNVDIGAQSDQLKIQARDVFTLRSANGKAEISAGRVVHLATHDGASITLEDGRITVSCPGKMTVHAGLKDFDAPTSTSPGTPRTKSL